MTFLYRDIIKSAWKISWHNKFLWFFGLFAALLGNGGEYEILFRNVDAVSNQQKLLAYLQSFSNSGRFQLIWKNLNSVFESNTVGYILFLLIALVIFAFVVWLIIISQGGLIDSTFKLQTNQKANLESGFKAGRKYFTPLFLLNLISKVIIYGLLVVVGIPLVLLFLSKNDSLWNVLFILSSFIILVPLSIVVSFIIKYATAYVVSKNEKFNLALKDGYLLFRKNWLISLEMALIIFIINLILGLGLIILISITAVPFILLGLIFYSISATAALYLIFTLGVIAVFLVIFVIGAFISTFQWTAWIILFKQLTEDKGASKLSRIFSKLPDYFGKS